ncbi:hypothetical protein C8R48DRAFT_774570 [Suillus tomentosus]|nr:hypothetical protein C8R48DRAFT_774570 [Suillus tomentosus]
MLASYIADTPEAMMLECVGEKTSPVTMVMYKYFGDPFQHEPQTRSKTLVQLDMKFRLNGIDKPFWSDWLLADLSWFLTPESLHHIHKQFWDHDVQWIILAVGGSEIDFWFLVIQPTTGYQHFHGASADAVPAGVIVAVCALMHFRYLMQSLCIDDKNLGHITAALSEFHANKHAIIAAWSTSLLDHSQGEDPGVVGDEFVEEDDEIDDDANDFPAELLSSIRIPAQPRPIVNYFSLVRILQHKEIGLVPVPLHSFTIRRTALHLSYDPSIRNATVDEVAIMFCLSDLRPAIVDFLYREATYGNHIHSISGPRRSTHDAQLPFDHLQVWFKIRLQETDFHDPNNVLPMQTLNCAPPSGPWTLGRYDMAIIQTNSRHSWTTSGLLGTFFLSLRAILTKLKNNPKGIPLAKLGLSLSPLPEVGCRGHGTISS